MKKWKCTVCGYIHEGPEPPEKCPVCGADKTKFILYTEEEEKKDKEAKARKEAEKAAKAAAAKPAEAKLADARPAEAAPAAAPASGKAALAQKAFGTLKDLMVKHHAHPILVHIPNGVVPVTFLLALLAILFQSDRMAGAVFFNLLFVALAMPLVLFSGFLDWKRKYNSAMTHLFIVKMSCGGIVTALALALTAWMVKTPQVLLAEGRGVFLLLFLAMLAAAGLAGFMGGKLVFKEG